MFGVVKNKIMYGKKVKGIERSTFLIDANGMLRAEWRGIKVAGHVDEVLKAVKALEESRLSRRGRLAHTCRVVHNESHATERSRPAQAKPHSRLCGFFVF